jgi:hypothetical protein
MPVPDSGIAAGEPAALLTIEMLPVAALAVVGAKVAVIAALLPALIVNGKLTPPTLKPVPADETWVIVRAALPAFVSVMVWFALLPTATLP